MNNDNSKNKQYNKKVKKKNGIEMGSYIWDKQKRWV